jgi:membrane-associated protease RseP (regulator of RpoE activity)
MSRAKIDIRKIQAQAEVQKCRDALWGLLMIKSIYPDDHDVIILGTPTFEGRNWKEAATQRLSSLGYSVRFEPSNGQMILELTRQGVRRPVIPRTNLILFLFTVLTTFAAGAVFLKGKNILANPLLLLDGASFAVPLLLILLFHEFGHYLMSRKRRIKTSLPYFIPGPTILGTFGAVIKSKSPFRSRRDLLDVGAAGPIPGFIVAIVVVILGLSHSQITAEIPEAGLTLGNSLIFLFLSKLVLSVPPGHDVLLSPMAFAGWAGLFVTMLNLLPIGQLDGGHIAYALFGKHQKKVAKYTVFALIPLGILWMGWFLWAVLAFVIKLGHPPTLNDTLPLDRNRRIIGFVSFAIFLLCFTPVPIK